MTLNVNLALPDIILRSVYVYSISSCRLRRKMENNLPVTVCVCVCQWNYINVKIIFCLGKVQGFCANDVLKTLYKSCCCCVCFSTGPGICSIVVSCLCFRCDIIDCIEVAELKKMVRNCSKRYLIQDGCQNGGHLELAALLNCFPNPFSCLATKLQAIRHV